MNIGIVVALIALIGFAAVATVLIGLSKQNVEGNPDYDKKIGKNTLRLTLIYAVATIAAVLAFIWWYVG
ncbi:MULTISPECIES: hypothetical protein [Paenibacillus]|uniref:Uncharacterized protein n=1 Tax=Paenibacillus oceani TaxID=2772510 RepID=A0A927CFW5_9BACL|nr:hypothetical protein [Paenibacillus oceani]MBD2865030.1 hypothetical protein [Paenibacillus oceani]MDF2660565.1 hypothetical protein [Paenibacillus sp.]